MRTFALLAVSLVASTQAVELHSSHGEEAFETALNAHGGLCCILFNDTDYDGDSKQFCLDPNLVDKFGYRKYTDGFLLRNFDVQSMMCAEGTSFKLSRGRDDGTEIYENDYEGIYKSPTIPALPDNKKYRFIQIDDRENYHYALSDG